MGAVKNEYLPYYTYKSYIQWEGVSGTVYAMIPPAKCDAKIDFDFVFERFR